ncbi:unnamed protein product [Phytomonas sp. EM1]|nr:unnamed protein product [Phytomonas sp. EM1]|eukprot:CCW64526.1 unnamed protein product [Phytomonas sp. isolate EM1]
MADNALEGGPSVPFRPLLRNHFERWRRGVDRPLRTLRNYARERVQRWVEVDGLRPHSSSPSSHFPPPSARCIPARHRRGCRRHQRLLDNILRREVYVFACPTQRGGGSPHFGGELKKALLYPEELRSGSMTVKRRAVRGLLREEGIEWLSTGRAPPSEEVTAMRESGPRRGVLFARIARKTFHVPFSQPTCTPDSSAAWVDYLIHCGMRRERALVFAFFFYEAVEEDLFHDEGEVPAAAIPTDSLFSDRHPILGGDGAAYRKKPDGELPWCLESDSDEESLEKGGGSVGEGMDPGHHAAFDEDKRSGLSPSRVGVAADDSRRLLRLLPPPRVTWEAVVNSTRWMLWDPAPGGSVAASGPSPAGRVAIRRAARALLRRPFSTSARRCRCSRRVFGYEREVADLLAAHRAAWEGALADAAIRRVLAHDAPPPEADPPGSRQDITRRVFLACVPHAWRRSAGIQDDMELHWAYAVALEARARQMEMIGEPLSPQ